ncbi:MAG: hypothetical protein EBY39_13920 [Flavobacteriia bacterium]|jgi:hypothetical protein|nr:hypothetical protein [Flavobacteriia bacterium]
MTLSKIADTLNKPEIERKPFVEMAKYFESDVVENLTKTHFELAEVTDFTYDQWQEFLSEPAIAGWISNNVKMLASVAERRKLQRLGEEGTNTADANSFKALKDFNDQGKTVDHSNVVIVHLPDLDGEEK